MRSQLELSPTERIAVPLTQCLVRCSRRLTSLPAQIGLLCSSHAGPCPTSGRECVPHFLLQRSSTER